MRDTFFLYFFLLCCFVVVWYVQEWRRQWEFLLLQCAWYRVAYFQKQKFLESKRKKGQLVFNVFYRINKYFFFKPEKEKERGKEKIQKNHGEFYDKEDKDATRRCKRDILFPLIGRPVVLASLGKKDILICWMKIDMWYWCVFPFFLLLFGFQSSFMFDK